MPTSAPAPGREIPHTNLGYNAAVGSTGPRLGAENPRPCFSFIIVLVNNRRQQEPQRTASGLCVLGGVLTASVHIGFSPWVLVQLGQASCGIPVPR